MRIRSILVLFTSILLSFSISANPVVKPESLGTIVLATSEWKPYVQNNPEYFGFAYETVEAAFKEAGLNVKIVFMPWALAQQAVKSGEVDGVFPEYFEKKHSKEFAYSKSFSGGPIGLYHLKKKTVKFHVKNASQNQKTLFQQLAQYRFGAVKEYLNVSAFDDNLAIRKFYVDTDKQNIEQLLDGTVDLIIMDKFVARYLMQNEFPAGTQNLVEFMQPALANKNLYLAVPRSNPKYRAILAAFNYGIKKIQQNGKLSNFLDKDSRRLGLEFM